MVMTIRIWNRSGAEPQKNYVFHNLLIQKIIYTGGNVFSTIF